MVDSGASLHISYRNKNLTNIEELKIDVTVGNVQNMKCEIKGMVNMKLQGWKTVKFNDFLYVPKAVKNILSVLGVSSKGATMGDTKDKTTRNKIGVNMIMDARKGKHDITMFYLKAKRYYQEGSLTLEEIRNIPEEK